jgi:hypothetical protein
MSEENSHKNPVRPTIRMPWTFEEAIGNAARVLEHAEMETDNVRMQGLDQLADSWATIAALIAQKDC